MRQKLNHWKRLTGLVVVGFLGASYLSSPLALAAGNTCNWTGLGNGTLWSDSSNWSGCGGTAPQNGDNLVFDNTSLANSVSLQNDISNLQVGSITFSGTNMSGHGYTISGNDISLANGITTSTSGPAPNTLDLNITLTADQTFNFSSLLPVGSTTNTLNIGVHHLTINATSGGIDLFSHLVGSGTVDFGNTSYVSYIDNSNPNFSGPVNLTSGPLIINASNTNQLGTGPVTVASGATLQESINANGTYSFANALTLGGSGTGSTGAIDVHGFSATGTVDFSGAVTLSSNATVSLENSNADFSGTVSGCGYSLSAQAGSSGTLSGNLTGSCTTSSSNSTSTNTAVAPNVDPKPPATGYGQPVGIDSLSWPLVISGIVSMAGGTLIIFRSRSSAR